MLNINDKNDMSVKEADRGDRPQAAKKSLTHAGTVSLPAMIRENLHYNLGTLLLGLLVMVFNYPINLALNLSDIKNSMDTFMTTQVTDTNGPTSIFMVEKISDYARRMTAAANNVLSGEGSLILVIVPVAAILCARCMFNYLMSRSTVDFYLSEPVSRTKRFFANFLSGIIIMFICLMTGYLLALAVAVAFGVQGLMVAGSLTACAGYMLSFMILYLTVILAMLACGRPFAAVAAVIVINGFAYSIYAILMVYQNFFETYMVYGASPLDKLSYGAPLYYFGELCANIASKAGPMGTENIRLMGLMAAIVLGLTALAAVLHRIRPSEACGRTLAFPVSKLSLRIILTIIGGLLMSFLGVYQSGLFWVFFFAILGVLICHAIIEAVFNMDIRTLLSHKLEAAGCVALTVGFMCIYILDPFGYDRYVPKAEDVSSVAVDFSGYFAARDAIIRSDYEYSFRSERPEDIYSSEYWAGEPDILGRMYISEEPYVEAALNLGQRGADHASGINDGKSYSFYSTSEDAEETYIVCMAYRLRSGKTRYRQYLLSDSDIQELMPDVFASIEYKEAMYPILGISEDQLGLFGIEYASEKEASELVKAGALDGSSLRTEACATRDWEPYGEVYDINKDQELRADLLSALQADIREMSFDDYTEWQYAVDSGYNEETKRVEVFSSSELYQGEDIPGTYIVKDLLYYIPESAILIDELESEDPYSYERYYSYRDIYPVFDSFDHVREVLEGYGLSTAE